MAFSADLVQKVWDKERAVTSQDPRVWRKDECGAWIRREHYRRMDAEFGWDIDYLTPGGPDHPDNLRAVNCRNRSGGGQLRCAVVGDTAGVHNREI